MSSTSKAIEWADELMDELRKTIREIQAGGEIDPLDILFIGTPLNKVCTKLGLIEPPDTSKTKMQMVKWKRISPAVIKTVVNLRNQRFSYAEIAEQTGLSYTQINYILSVRAKKTETVTDAPQGQEEGE